MKETRLGDPNRDRRLTAHDPIPRRGFLKAAAWGSISVAAFPRWLFARDCSLTTADVIGPFWVPNAPVRTVLASPDEPGQRLFISGRVFASDCLTPLQGVIVDVWHSTDAGCYSAVGMNCPDEDPFNLRGQMLTDANGEYAYETILPGYYGNRCRHVHYRISPPEGGLLVTQLYFEGDPKIPDDPYASRPEAAGRIIPLTEDENGLHGIFPLTLNVDATDVADPEDIHPTATALFQSYPNPFQSKATIRFQTSLPGPADLAAFDSSGRRVRTLLRGQLEAGYHTVHWNGDDDGDGLLPSGTYTYTLTVGSIVKAQKLVIAR